METKEMKVVAGAILVGLVAFAVCAIYVNGAGATSIGTKWVDEGDVKWGECQTEVKTACGNVEGTQYGSQKQRCKLTQGGGFTCVVGHTRNVEVSQSCVVEGPVCEEPTDYCDTLEGVQSEEDECPVPVHPVVKEDKKSGDGCEDPSKPQGFRYQFQGSGNLLKWEKKGSWDKVDIAVFGMDKTTLLYNIRTADDGEHLMPTQNTWHRIRGVNKCGLGEWSKLIN